MNIHSGNPIDAINAAIQSAVANLSIQQISPDNIRLKEKYYELPRLTILIKVVVLFEYGGTLHVGVAYYWDKK